jgi:sigma-E factor negative regulatory protein RseC
MNCEIIRHGCCHKWVFDKSAFYGVNMLEEQGIVIKVEKDFAWVKMQRKSSCGHCSAKEGCSTKAIEDIFKKDIEVRAIDHSHVQVGDRVVVGLEEGALLKSSFTVYLIPLLSMLSATIFYETFAEKAFLPAHEILTVLAGLVGLAAGLLWIQHSAKKMSQDERYHPVVLKIIH